MFKFSGLRFASCFAAACLLLAGAAGLQEAQAHAVKAHESGGAVKSRPFISLSPSVIMLHGKAGESFLRTLQMTNGTPVPLAFRLLAMDVVVHKGKRAFVAAGETPGSIAATAIFTPREVTIPPHQAARVTVTLTVPVQTALRAVVVEFRGLDRVQMPGHVRATASLGGLVTFDLAGEAKIDASPASVVGQTATSNAAVDEWLRNTGSDPAVVQGTAAILTPSGGVLTRTPFPTKRLLPGERLRFKAEIPAQLQPGRYRAFTTFLCAGKTITESANFDVQ